MTDPFDQLFNSFFFCKNNRYSFSRLNDESYGKIKLVIYGRKIMENKNNHLSPKPSLPYPVYTNRSIGSLNFTISFC